MVSKWSEMAYGYIWMHNDAYGLICLAGKNIIKQTTCILGVSVYVRFLVAARNPPHMPTAQPHFLSVTKFHAISLC